MFKVMLMCRNEAKADTKIPALVGIMKEETIFIHTKDTIEILGTW